MTSLIDQALRLRAEGKSRNEILAELHIGPARLKELYVMAQERERKPTLTPAPYASGYRVGWGKWR